MGAYNSPEQKDSRGLRGGNPEISLPGTARTPRKLRTSLERWTEQGWGWSKKKVCACSGSRGRATDASSQTEADTPGQGRGCETPFPQGRHRQQSCRKPKPALREEKSRRRKKH